MSAEDQKKEQYRKIAYHIIRLMDTRAFLKKNAITEPEQLTGVLVEINSMCNDNTLDTFESLTGSPLVGATKIAINEYDFNMRHHAEFIKKMDA